MSTQPLNVVVLAPVCRPENTARLVAMFREQKHPRKTLVIVENGPAVGRTLYSRNIHVVASLNHQSHARNAGIEYILRRWGGDAYVVNMDDDDYYSPHYLTEHVKLAERGVIHGKRNGWILTNGGLIFVQDWEAGAVNRLSLNGGTIGGFARDLARYPIVDAGEEAGFLDACRANGIIVRNMSARHYVYDRTGNPSDHTYKIRTEKLLTHTSGLIKVAGSVEDLIDLIPSGPLDKMIYRRETT